MSDPGYTIKEILDLQFRNLGKDISEIKNTLKEQTHNTDKRFSEIEVEIASLKEDNAKYKTLWGIGATVGASLVAIITGRIF